MKYETDFNEPFLMDIINLQRSETKDMSLGVNILGYFISINAYTIIFDIYICIILC